MPLQLTLTLVSLLPAFMPCVTWDSNLGLVDGNVLPTHPLSLPTETCLLEEERQL